MKILSLCLITVLLIVSGCAEGGGSDPTVPPQGAQTPNPSPAKTPENPDSPTPESPAPDPIPAPKLLTWKISGTIRDGGTFTGTFKYDPKAIPRATNIRNLSPNVEYALSDWNIVLSPTSSPEVIYTPANTTLQEFCIGSCIFSVSSPAYKLSWTDGVTNFYIVSPIPAGVTTLGLPVMQQDWGPIDLFASGVEHRYGTGRFDFTLVLLASATIQAVQEEQ